MSSNDRSSGTSSGNRRRSKVERVIDEYGLDGLGVELEEKWTDSSTERYSLRELADYVNRKLVEASMSSPDAIEGEVENFYRLLTDDDVSSGVRTHVENKLEQDGVDVGKLRDDFVSHQAVHTYLTEFRETEFSSGTRDAADRLADRKRTIARLQNRLAAVSESTLRNLSGTDELELGSFNLMVNVQVYCEDCGTQREIGTLLQRGHCECTDPAESAEEKQ